MRFLLDQDVYAVTIQLLEKLGHDVVLARQLGLSRAADEELLRAAREKNCILVTRDRDYGNLVFVKSMRAGVIYLRMLPATQNEVHTELGKVLSRYSESELNESFIVIEADGYRVRKVEK